MEKACDAIKAEQKSWASAEHIDFDNNGHVKELRQNLFLEMEEDAKQEFAAGKGRELEGHMLALHSSSALVVNFFYWWRQSNLVPVLARILGLEPMYLRLDFEKTHTKPQGVSGIQPHLDVELTGMLEPVAIEAKYTEPYRPGVKSLKPIYGAESVWDKYPKCLSLAKSILSGEKVFEYLDAPQLLKHIAGLKTDYVEKGFELIYLWYHYPSDEATRHEDEIKIFSDCIREEVYFRVLTYQELFDFTQGLHDVEKQYIAYLRKRYFPEEIFPLEKRPYMMSG